MGVGTKPVAPGAKFLREQNVFLANPKTHPMISKAQTRDSYWGCGGGLDQQPIPERMASFYYQVAGLGQATLVRFASMHAHSGVAAVLGSLPVWSSIRRQWQHALLPFWCVCESCKEWYNPVPPHQ